MIRTKDGKRERERERERWKEEWVEDNESEKWGFVVVIFISTISVFCVLLNRSGSIQRRDWVTG